VAVGTVEELELAPDMTHVLVRARMTRSVKESLSENTRFYIVAPHVGVAALPGGIARVPQQIEGGAHLAGAFLDALVMPAGYLLWNRHSNSAGLAKRGGSVP